MTTREYAERSGLPLRKVRQIVATLPGAMKVRDSQGRAVWDIPESALEQAPPAQAQEESPFLRPQVQRGRPVEEERAPEESTGLLIPGLIFLVILTLVILPLLKRPQSQ